MDNETQCARCKMEAELNSENLCATCTTEVDTIKKAKDDAQTHSAKMEWDKANLD